MNRFRHGALNLLIATDVAARGLDVENLTHVIHFDLPDEAAVYNHRSGRTGRAGKTGQSLALVHLREGHRIRRIEKVLGREIRPGRIPDGTEICKKQLENLAVQLKDSSEKDTLSHTQSSILPPYWLEIFQKHLGFLTADELIERLVVRELGPLLREYSHAEDLNPPSPPKRSRKEAEHNVSNRRSGGKSGPVGAMVHLRVNLGRQHSVLPPQIIGLVNQVSRTRNIRLGRIDIHSDWSEFQVEGSKAARVEEALQGFNYRGVVIRVERMERFDHSRFSSTRGSKKYTGKGSGKKHRSSGKKSKKKH